MTIYRTTWFLGVLIGSCTILVAQRTSLDSPENVVLLRNMKKWFVNVFGSSGRDELLKSAKNKNHVQNYYTKPFPCDVSHGRSTKVPTSVNRLRPGDIDVVCVMGDSLSAGFGIFATNPLHLFAENRGASFDGGGQSTWREYLTLPNILKEFNPNLIGYSYSDSFSFETSSQFNAAESLAVSKDMPYMAQVLIDRLKSDSRVDVKNHWKMIVLMIGANDMCSEMCILPKPSMILSNHQDDMLKTLRLLRDQLPKTFVVLVSPPNLKTLVGIRDVPNYCYYFRIFFCPCLFMLTYKEYQREFEDIMDSWSYAEEVIARLPEFHTDDFTVEVQPILGNITWPKVASTKSDDLTYISADCFHVSQKSHARVANGLWNNLLQPDGEKQRNWHEVFEKFLCPTKERPYLITLNNSNISFENHTSQYIV